LKNAGGELIREEFLQRRDVLDLPEGHEIDGVWLRVRDEGNMVTCTLKIVDGERIDDQREVMIDVSDYSLTVELLKMMGAR